MKIVFGLEFIPEKTSDKFIEVKIYYDDHAWDGALPLKLRYQGYEITAEKLKSQSASFCNQIYKSNHKKWLDNHIQEWENQRTQTYKVFEVLLSHKWECRGCGPVPKVNPQAAARIRDIKKKNFVIASRRKLCNSCQSSQMHDILIPITIPKTAQENFRKSIPKKLQQRIIKLLGARDCVFDVVRTPREFVIDHKFPSQRWNRPESDNFIEMTDKEILAKFQLLTNQTNMLKSRACDTCVFEGKRASFMGLKWFYKGGQEWEGPKDLESGCVGCPWYDVDRWRKELLNTVYNQKNVHSE